MFLTVKRKKLAVIKTDFKERVVRKGVPVMRRAGDYRTTLKDLQYMVKQDPNVEIVPRYSLVFELRVAYRIKDGDRLNSVRNRAVWTMTVKEEMTHGSKIEAIRTRKIFWKRLERIIAGENPQTISRIQKQVAELIPRPTMAELEMLAENKDKLIRGEFYS